MLLWISVPKVFCGCVFSFLVGVSLGVELLGQVVTLGLTEGGVTFSCLKAPHLGSSKVALRPFKLADGWGSLLQHRGWNTGSLCAYSSGPGHRGAPKGMCYSWRQC